MNINTAWRKRIDDLGLEEDAAQLAVVDVLQALQEQLEQQPSLLQRAAGILSPSLRPETPRGIYLWGGVGRGKTLLMDVFFDTLARTDKRRVHFHRFMNDVHERLGELRDVADPLDRVAGDLARGARVLCFDEFFVSDIGDAMLLAGLLEGLFRRDAVLVATSNSAPADLYRDGLQRARFLPAIDLLKRHTRVLHLEGDVDYRLRLLRRAGTFLTPVGEEADVTLDRYFHDIASASVEDGASIEVAGREIRTRKRAKGVAWFDFAELCGGPRSAVDYIEIARRYQTVILSGVPVLTADDENAARRFISLVDEFYDRRVKLIMSAAEKIESIYQGNKLSFEFQRTLSRLLEMQSPDYLHAAHLS
ncbi:MAG TPA: cell division protein ZapE [Woeseiaceae bacterium]|nr:cell division protein ZapE [Woeseiaceae bacterium]